MLHSGLVSVTFRDKSPAQIVELVARAGLEGIEWGGDVHVPHGDRPTAREVRQLTDSSGLRVAAYGSYYRVGVESGDNPDFDGVLSSALELEAPTIRVWAGDTASRSTDEAGFRRVVEDARRICKLCEREGIAVAFEYHNNTLTDSTESAQRLVREVGSAALFCYWQALGYGEVDDQESSLMRLLPLLRNVHVHHVDDSGYLPLRSGEDRWRRYLDIARQVDSEVFCMTEFVRGGVAEQFLEDASVLKRLVEST